MVFSFHITYSRTILVLKHFSKAKSFKKYSKFYRFFLCYCTLVEFYNILNNNVVSEIRIPRYPKYSRTLRYRRMTNAPRRPSSRVPTPRCDREETAPYEKDTRIPTTDSRTEGRPLLGDYTQLTHARHKPRSRPCLPNWIKTSDAQVSRKGEQGYGLCIELHRELWKVCTTGRPSLRKRMNKGTLWAK